MKPLVRLSVSLLRAYKRWLSPLLPRACRFSPTCSEYGQIALRSHGLIVGGWLTAGRLLRCQPLGRGGIDIPAETLCGTTSSLRVSAARTPRLDSWMDKN